MFCEAHGLPVGETQAGKSTLPDDHPLNIGAIGVTGTGAANALAAEADVMLAVGTRLQDFTTGSWSLFRNRRAAHHRAERPALRRRQAPRPAARRATPGRGWRTLDAALGGWTAPAAWTERAPPGKRRGRHGRRATPRPTNADLPTRRAGDRRRAARTPARTDVVVCAAGGLPGELHKLWQAGAPGGYHMEYGYSCMGYEIAGGLGVKMADPTARSS